MEVTKEHIPDGEIRKDAVVDKTILSCLCNNVNVKQTSFFQILSCKCLDVNFNTVLMGIDFILYYSLII